MWKSEQYLKNEVKCKAKTTLSMSFKCTREAMNHCGRIIIISNMFRAICRFQLVKQTFSLRFLIQLADPQSRPVVIVIIFTKVPSVRITIIKNKEIKANKPSSENIDYYWWVIGTGRVALRRFLLCFFCVCWMMTNPSLPVPYIMIKKRGFSWILFKYICMYLRWLLTESKTISKNLLASFQKFGKNWS